MSIHPAYPELFKGGSLEWIDKAYTVDGKRIWQSCYICGLSITFSRDGGKWQSIGGELIRHKACEPPTINHRGGFKDE